MQVPNHLVEQIRSGDCVAFVGAGFSAPVVPQWTELLDRLAATLPTDDPVRTHVAKLLNLGSARDLEAAAQLLRDALGPVEFRRQMVAHLGDPPVNDTMRARIEHLQGIPFRAVLTTNFDGLLDGALPGRDAYLQVLRPFGHRWWDERYWAGTDTGPAVVKLHGSVASDEPVVFTQSDYRRRLYGSAAYTTFLRSVLATTTVLYLGFSFTDAYLNELRSEILALLDYRGGDHPVAYAVVNDVTREERDYLRRHEGIEVISYDSHGQTDFSGFDEILGEIFRATNPKLALGRLLVGKRILWVDPKDYLNDFGMEFLRSAVADAGGNAALWQVPDVESALMVIEGKGADLVITNWGYASEADGSTSALRLLGEIRRRDLRVPVVVFASGSHAVDNKRAALAAGATSYEFSWEGLFREIERVFAPPSAL